MADPNLTFDPSQIGSLVPASAGPGNGLFGQPSQPQEAQVPNLDTSSAIKEPDGKVWVKRGDKLYTIPEDQLGPASQHIEGLSFASQEEVEARRQEQKVKAEPGGAWNAALQHFGTSFLDFVTSPVRGVAALGSAGAGYLGLDKTERALQDFAKDSGGEALAKDSAYLLHGGVEGEHDFVQAYQARERAFPLAAGLGRAAGLVVPAVATAIATGGASLAGSGAEAGAGSALDTLATTIFSPSGIKSVAASGAVSGLAQGAAAPFETMDDTPISREAILASGGMGAVLGGVIGGGVGAFSEYAPGVLSKVFGKTATKAEREAAVNEIHASLPDTIKQLADSDLSEGRDLYRSIIDKGSKSGRSAQKMADRIEQAATDAGPNPELRNAAIQDQVKQELARIRGEVSDVTKENWRDPKLTPDDLVFHRDVLKEGARDEIAKNLEGLQKESTATMEYLKNFELKRPLVAKNLKDMTDEEAVTAFQRSRETIEDMNSTFQDLLEYKKDNILDISGASKTAKSMLHTFEKAKIELGTAESPADAYIVMDRVRREIDKRIPSLRKQVMSNKADEAYEGKVLFDFAEGAYERTRKFLADSSTWGKQGLQQAKVNQAWADDIMAEGRVTKLGAFFARDVQDRYGQMALRVDPEKIERYLGELGTKTLPDQDLTRMLETKTALMREVSSSYEIPASQVKRAVDSANNLRDSLKAAHRVMTESGGLATQVSNILSSRAAKMVGHAVGGVAGGAVGTIAGGTAGLAGVLVGHSVGAAVEEYAAHRIPALINQLAKRELETGIGKLPSVYQKKLSRNILAGIPVGSRWLFDATNSEPKDKRLEAYRARTDALAKLTSNPDLLGSTASRAFNRFGRVQSTFPQTLQLDTQAKLAALQQAWPKQAKPSLVKTKALNTPSDQDMRKSENMWLATTHPLGVFDDFARGKVDPDRVSMTWQQHPELQRLFQAAAVDTLESVSDKELLPSNVMGQLDFLLGFNGTLDDTLDRGLSQRMTALAPAPNNQAPPQSTDLKLPGAEPTFTQRLSGDHKDT